MNDPPDGRGSGHIDDVIASLVSVALVALAGWQYSGWPASTQRLIAGGCIGACAASFVFAPWSTISIASSRRRWTARFFFVTLACAVGGLIGLKSDAPLSAAPSTTDESVPSTEPIAGISSTSDGPTTTVASPTTTTEAASTTTSPPTVPPTTAALELAVPDQAFAPGPYCHLENALLRTEPVHALHCVYEIDAGGTRFNQSTQDPKAILRFDVNLPPMATRLKGTILFGDFTSPATVSVSVSVSLDGQASPGSVLVDRGTPYVVDLDVTDKSVVSISYSVPEQVQPALAHADILLIDSTYIK